MKKILMIVLFICSLITQKTIAQEVSVSLSTFQTQLSPYGRWVDYPQYGQVWICNDPGFRPYYNSGHWVYTDYGWTWVSDYPWGWAPFHYGRWAYVPDDGWIWVPGYEWAPAWVSWCDGGGYYGWAPLGPGLSVSVSIGSIPAERWCFVQHQYINSAALNAHYINASRNATIYRNVTVVNNVHITNNINYAAGPRREDVQRITHQQIQTHTINYSANPGRSTVSGHGLNMYRLGASVAAHNRPANGNGQTHIHPQATATHPTAQHVHKQNVPHRQHAQATPQNHVIHQQSTQPQQVHVQHQQVQHQQINMNSHPVRQHNTPVEHSIPQPHSMEQPHGSPAGPGGGGERRDK